MLTIEQALKIVASMNVPQFKQDVSRSPNILWLVNNLNVRNRAHKEYQPVMGWLIDQAEERNLMKKSEIERHRAAFQPGA